MYRYKLVDAKSTLIGAMVNKKQLHEYLFYIGEEKNIRYLKKLNRIKSNYIELEN